MRGDLPLPVLLLVWTALALPAAAQDATDPMETLARADSLCAEDAGSAACLLARAQSVAIMANTVAEAGNTRDRGSFIDPVRALLADPSPEIRTSALYALSKLGPDASDTPALLALARDPVSNVRAGAWSAARNSSDAAARRIAQRVGEAPTGTGYGADGLAYEPSVLGLALPQGLEFLWLAADQRKEGQLHFLSSVPPDDLLGRLAPLAAGPAQPLMASLAADPALGEVLSPFLDSSLYGNPRFLSLAENDDLPPRLGLVFDDLAFGQTGLAVIFTDARSLVPPIPEPPSAAPSEPIPQDADFAAALLRQSGFRPEADPEESDLFLAIAASGGYGAADYLEVYPDGAYAEEARAYLAAPQIVPGALSIMDTEDITFRLSNLPDGAMADIRIVPKLPDAQVLTEQRLYDAARETARFPPDSRLVPGVYWAIATVDPGDGSPEFSLIADFSVTMGQAALTADKSEYAAGEQISVQFSGMSGDSQDYVSTAPAGSPNHTFLQYAYTQGAREGSLVLTAPTAPGAYELRAFFREDESVLRASLPFTVAGSATQPGDAAAATPPLPGTPAPEARATLALDKTRYAPGEAITVTYADMFGHPMDYVATVPAGAPYASYLQYRYTEGAKAGIATLNAPMEPGDYEVRAFFMEDEGILRGSVAFTVE